jgi:hypothetical protein
MTLTNTFAWGAVTIFCASSIALAADTDSSDSGGTGSSSQSETLILLEPVEIENLYGVDEDDDGLIDYLILEESAA